MLRHVVSEIGVMTAENNSVGCSFDEIDEIQILLKNKNVYGRM
jgi:hypothetical protein